MFGLGLTMKLPEHTRSRVCLASQGPWTIVNKTTSATFVVISVCVQSCWSSSYASIKKASRYISAYAYQITKIPHLGGPKLSTSNPPSRSFLLGIFPRRRSSALCMATGSRPELATATTVSPLV